MQYSYVDMQVANLLSEFDLHVVKSLNNALIWHHRCKMGFIYVNKLIMLTCRLFMSICKMYVFMLPCEKVMLTCMLT